MNFLKRIFKKEPVVITKKEKEFIEYHVLRSFEGWCQLGPVKALRNLKKAKAEIASMKVID
ncbi:MAG: hypothetical protein KGV50_02560 [Gammaproteobacteria bacterium]|nr:hypothetical protein [Gammaproteobacteria bacterium]